MSEPLGEEREGRLVAAVPADTFAHRLMLARSHAGHLTIQQAAAHCALRHQSWSNWERGMMPRTDQAALAGIIAEALGVDRDWLLHGGPLSAPVRTVRSNSGAVRPPYSHHRATRARNMTESPDRPMSNVRRPKRLDHRVAA